MQPSPLSPAAQRLIAQLDFFDAQPAGQGPAFHVASIGGGFYFAYEQLRNVAENRERHLLLRSALERYLTRYVNLTNFRPVGADLVTELTQAGYLKNDTVPMPKLAQIDALLEGYSGLVGAAPHQTRAQLQDLTKWLLQIASVQIEDMLLPNRRLAIVMAFAYEHYLGAVDRASNALPGQSDQAYQVAIYCAMQRAIFKSDLATVRYYCLAATLPGLGQQSLPHFMEVNKLIDGLYQSPQTNRLVRLINRYGAPMRILRELIDNDNTRPASLADRGETLGRVKRLCAQAYAATHKRLGARIIKTILFVFITKVLIGVAIEVPYDLVAAGVISWTPLIFNVSFPVAYMILLSAGITSPDRHNTELVASFIERILYDGGEPIQYRLKQRVNSASLKRTFNVVYTVGFLVSFGLLSWALYRLGFNAVNGLIFFIFLSAVSFLGFRLRQSTRELALLDLRQGIIQTTADFLLAPFVRVGYWLSDRYARLNFVTRLLDAAIEMPLKTLLRLVRQWVGFIRDKQEEL